MAIRERLSHSDYVIVRRYRSRIDPSKTITEQVGTRCPSCKRENPLVGHGQTVTCACGLSMTAYGNAIYCEKNAPTLSIVN